jgi:hypothetical protein
MSGWRQRGRANRPRIEIDAVRPAVDRMVGRDRLAVNDHAGQRALAVEKGPANPDQILIELIPPLSGKLFARSARG